MGIFVSACITTFLLHYLVSGHNVFDEGKWRQAGQYLTQHVDASKKPCEHFYDHVCGKFGDQYDDETFRATDTEDLEKVIKNTVQEVIVKIESLDHEKPEGRPTSPIEDGTLRFFRGCVSGQQGGDIRENFDQASNDTVNRLWSAAAVGLDDDADNDGESEQRWEARWRLVGSLLRELGASVLPIDEDHQAYELSIDRSGNNGTTTLIIELGPPHIATERREMNFEGLLALVPEIDWITYFDELLGAGTTDAWKREEADSDLVVFHVFGDRYLNEMGEGVNELDTDQFRTLIEEAVRMHLQEELLIGGTNDTRSLCIKHVIERQPAAITPLYLRHIGTSPSELRSDILIMKRNVFSAFQYLLNSVDWLDAEDKEKVYSKLDEMNFSPGIPDWAEDEARVIQAMRRYTYDDSEAANGTASPFSAEIGWLKADQMRKLGINSSTLKEQEDDENGDAINFDINAWYSTGENEIGMDLGYIIPPIYDVSYPLAAKYGQLGFTIAHELIHAFDAHGLQTPSIRHANDWLPERAWKEFEKRKACLVRQYSSFCIRDKAYCVSGARNIGENMADIDGLKVAYTAFKFAQQVHGADPPIPSMLNYTDDQIFFIAAARVECARGWDEVWTTDPHSPQKARVDVMMRNVPLFARAYRCEVGSTYAPMKTCSVWGDLANPARKRRSISAADNSNPVHK